MADRYFSQHAIVGDRAQLTGSEAHHLSSVMRAKPGAEIVLFDGSGDEFLARIESIRRDCVDLVVIERRTVDRESRIDLTIAVALPKGDRQRWLIEKLVEIGVTSIIPLVTRRGVSQPTDSAIDRLRRAVIEAAKQCGRNRLMRVLDPRTWPDLASGSESYTARYIAHPSSDAPGDSLPVTLAGHGVDQKPAIIAAIGPEGGFAPEEIESAVAAGWQIVDLGPQTLRVETAAIVISTLFLAHGRVVEHRQSRAARSHAP